MKVQANLLSTLTLKIFYQIIKLKHLKNAIELTRKFTDISKEHKHHKTLLLFSPNLQWKSMDQKCQGSALAVPLVFQCEIVRPVGLLILYISEKKTNQTK